MVRFFCNFAVVFLVQSALAQQAANDGNSSSNAGPGKIESQATVFADSHTDPDDPSNYYGFNHAASVTVLGGDRVMCAWFSGPFEGAVNQVILGAVSEDGGRSWGKSRVVNDAPRVSDFDPGFINAGGRTLLFFSNGLWTEPPSPGPNKSRRPMVGVDSFFMLLTETSDQGKTWSEVREVGAGAGWNCRSNGIKLSNGTLLMPTHHLKAPHTSSVLLSTDNGSTWTRGPEIVTPENVGSAEPSVAELPGGKLVMVLRTTDGNLWLVRSADYGRTWFPPERQDLPAAASSANLLFTSTGKLVLTHNPTQPPLRTQLTMRVSDDGGQTWTAPLTLAEIELKSGSESNSNKQVCYPSVCELSDGALLVVWARIAMNAENKSGAIESARVHLN